MRNYISWRKKSNPTGKVIIGTIAGIVAGFAAGILTAPRPGKETRDILLTRTSDVLETAKKNLVDGKNKIKEKSKETVEEVAEKAGK